MTSDQIATLKQNSAGQSDATLLSTGQTFCDKQKDSAQDRLNICTIGFWGMDHVVNKKVVGTMYFEFWASTWLTGRNKADQVLRAQVKFKVLERSGGSPPPPESWLAISIDCVGVCINSSLPDSSQKLYAVPGKSATWNYQGLPKVASGKVGLADIRWRAIQFVPVVKNPIVITPFNLLTMRCDDAVGSFAGCVNPNKPASAQFSKARAPKLTAHIAKAIDSGLPSRLNRSSANPSVVRSRRAAVCPKAVDRATIGGKNFTCDEYPFASTLQGGLTPVRVPSGCYLPVTGPTKANPDHYGASRCLVPDDEQNYQASVLGNMASLDRVLQNDVYQVKVVN